MIHLRSQNLFFLCGFLKRNLEWNGYQFKRFGWNLQYPPKDFYNRLVFKKHSGFMEAYVEHANGDILLKMSTKDLALRRSLFSSGDKCAAKNLAIFMASECIRAGFTHLDYYETETLDKSIKERTFYETVTENGVVLSEAQFVDLEEREVPGLDKDERDYFHEKRDVIFPPLLNKIKRAQLKNLIEETAP